jgi:phospholipid transport system substrate-binding protein
MKKLAFALISLCFWITAASAVNSPVELLQTTSNRLISQLQRNQTTLHNNPRAVYSIVNQILLPHVNLAYMSSRALGRDAWMQATPYQRKAFMQQFTTLLVRTYSSALAQYNNERVVFFPLRADYSNARAVQVDSRILRRSGPSIDVSYRLMNQAGQWKLYDFSVDGISMVGSFRAQFVQELQQGGLNGLIRKLAIHNSQHN